VNVAAPEPEPIAPEPQEPKDEFGFGLDDEPKATTEPAPEPGDTAADPLESEQDDAAPEATEPDAAAEAADVESADEVEEDDGFGLGLL